MPINEDPTEAAPAAKTLAHQPLPGGPEAVVATDVCEVREALADSLDSPEAAKPFKFERLWNSGQGKIEPFDEEKHRSQPKTFEMNGPVQTNYPAGESYQRIEDVLNQNQGALMKKIAREQFGVPDSNSISHPSIIEIFGGEEYVIFVVTATPGVDFTVAVSRNPASNEAMEKDYAIGTELRAHEARCKGIAQDSPEWKSPTGLGVMPYLHYEPGETEKPALLISPHIHNSYGAYGDQNCDRAESGDLRLKGDFADMPDLKIQSDAEERELVYQLARHQLELATSGRPVYPSLRRADYIYLPESKKFVLTCHRSPEFIARTYKKRDNLGYMYAPNPITDKYNSAAESCFVQTLHLIFLRYGTGFFYSLATVRQALLDATQNLPPEEKDKLYQRLLDEKEPIQLIPTSGIQENQYNPIAQERLSRFRRTLDQELKRRAKQVRKERLGLKSP